MNPIDILILWVSCICAILCIVLGISKIIKFYIWILLWFLASLLIQIKLNSLSEEPRNWHVIDYFFSSHTWFFELLSLLIIPIFGFFFLINNTITTKDSASSLSSTLISAFLWLFFLPLLLGFYSVIASITISWSAFMEHFMKLLSGSFLGKIFSDFQHYIFLLLFFILLYKFVLRFLSLILVSFLTKIRELRAEERENRKREESDNGDETNEE